MTSSATDAAFATAFDGAALVFARLFEQMIRIAQPVEDRPFPYGIWQHFPTGRKKSDFTDEFYVLQGDPEAKIAAMHAAETGARLYFDVIGTNPSEDDRAYLAAGYRCDWVEILMDRPLTAEDAARPDDPRIIRTLDSNQIERLAQVWTGGRQPNGYQPIVEAHNSTPELVQALIEIDGETAAYGRAIVSGSDAFISDVNAFPNFRRRGLGEAVMDALHAGAAQLGATRVVLTSTQMGLPLYEKLGYRTLAQVWIYDPAS
jgi:ribosomal protein S18 acetylase RimI-like enzyme